jgi:hypothetical protein
MATWHISAGHQEHYDLLACIRQGAGDDPTLIPPPSINPTSHNKLSESLDGSQTESYEPIKRAKKTLVQYAPRLINALCGLPTFLAAPEVAFRPGHPLLDFVDDPKQHFQSRLGRLRVVPPNVYPRRPGGF